MSVFLYALRGDTRPGYISRGGGGTMGWGEGAGTAGSYIYIYEPDTFRVYLASLIYIQYKLPS